MGDKMTDNDIDAGGKKFNKFFKYLLIAMVVFGSIAVVSTPSEDDDSIQTEQYSD